MKILASSIASISVLLACTIPASADHVVGYQFEEGTGSTTADSEAGVQGDQSGTLVADAGFASPNLSLTSPGSFSLTLDGTGDSVQISNPGPVIQNVTGYTFATFINLDGLPSGSSTMTVIGFGTGAAVDGSRAVLQITSSGQFGIGGRREDSDGFSRYISAANLLQVGVTAHLAATVDFSSGNPEVHLYLNGIEVPNTLASGSGFSPGTNMANTASLDARIGARPGGASEFVNGQIDDVKVWQRALTASQVAAQAIPEPAGALLLATGAAAVMGWRRRRH